MVFFRALATCFCHTIHLPRLAFLMFFHFLFMKFCACYHVMINPYHVLNILADLVSSRLTLNSTISMTQRDREVANMLFENMESILNSVRYSFENDFTLDSHNVAEVSDEMILSENDVNMKSNHNDDDGGGSDKSDDDTFAFDENFSIENEKEDVIRNEFYDKCCAFF